MNREKRWRRGRDVPNEIGAKKRGKIYYSPVFFLHYDNEKRESKTVWLTEARSFKGGKNKEPISLQAVAAFNFSRAKKSDTFSFVDDTSTKRTTSCLFFQVYNSLRSGRFEKRNTLVGPPPTQLDV